MITATQSKRYTPADLLSMPDGNRYELIDGQLVEKNMSFWSGYVAGELRRRLSEHCRPNKLGWVVPEGVTYQCFPRHPERVRKADTSFIRADRLSLAQATAEGHLPIAPDLGIEIVSPNDLAYDVDAKAHELLEAGVLLVWVVNPVAREIQVRHPDGSGVILGENDELSGENVVPGFRCRVGDLFQPPPGVQP
jgi:Uma2 family endonuclease